MRRTIYCCLAALLLASVLSTPADAIERVSRKLNFIELNGSYLYPVGNVERVMTVPREIIPLGFHQSSLDANDVYKSTYALGIAIGQVYSGRFMWSLGFRYTRHNPKDTVDIGTYFWPFDPKPDLNQYDIELNLNYYLLDAYRYTIAPYVGLGASAGILSAGWDDEFDSESETKALAAVNFGFDLRLWQSQDGRDMVSLVSANRYDILASKERPKYLTIGAALRFYIRP